jgi:hypothetical protein
MQYSVNKTMVYFLIFTVVASLIAFKLVVTGWDVTYETYYTSAMTQ